MKVLYDSQGFDMQKHGGVSRCFVELYKHLPKDVCAKFSVLETDNVYLNNIGIPAKGTLYDAFLSKKDSRIKKSLYKIYYNCKYGHYKHWDRMPQVNLYESMKQIERGDYDIFHPTFFSPYYMPFLPNKPLVLTVHDMITELYPNYYPATNSQVVWKKVVIPRADHIIAVSECTKRDLQKYFDVPDEKITVIYHGTDNTPYIPSGNKPIEGRYLLYVGDRWQYKNFGNFAKSVVPVLDRHKDLSVVCTGSPFNENEIQMLKRHGIYDRFIQIFVKSDKDFLDLYHHAVAFVYPSEYEGFGIPILEAYKAGCPVMLNNASCFPEIAGDAAVYFEMNEDGSNFEEQFEMLYSFSAAEKEAQLKKQRQQLSKYTWERSARQLAEVYRKLV